MDPDHHHWDPSANSVNSMAFEGFFYQMEARAQEGIELDQDTLNATLTLTNMQGSHFIGSELASPGVSLGTWSPDSFGMDIDVNLDAGMEDRYMDMDANMETNVSDASGKFFSIIVMPPNAGITNFLEWYATSWVHLSKSPEWVKVPDPSYTASFCYRSSVSSSPEQIQHERETQMNITVPPGVDPVWDTEKAC
ncbi:hypothetical protein BT96DRAFT_1004403 [Gymnopus androsaceus JB14]|uniref:Uncharacterized protein n=1 Tax=Gymnopus androsaceus JB14 TaxID=1447944 RepID=A0A6A4GR54_9AGAR|nr:hypothetical protein BT96DRAFT_1004403 [Gymnopus androsaceus JB14]